MARGEEEGAPGSGGPPKRKGCQNLRFLSGLIPLFSQMAVQQGFAIWVMLGIYAVLIGSLLATFRCNLSVPSSRVKQSKIIARHTLVWSYIGNDQDCLPKCAGHHSWTAWPLKMRPISYPETSLTNYQSTLRKFPEELSSQHCGGSLKSHNMALFYAGSSVFFPLRRLANLYHFLIYAPSFSV